MIYLIINATAPLKIIIFNRRSKNYSMIVATLPDPTVRPPSRIAKDNP